MRMALKPANAHDSIRKACMAAHSPSLLHTVPCCRDWQIVVMPLLLYDELGSSDVVVEHEL